ncbi:MAG TPA: ISL3 family transposase [Euzebya sp.]|nr:ISL3 family transposase [Euzebya sp.]
MRVTTVFNKLLRLTGVWVTAVDFAGDTVVVDVKLKRRGLVCPACGWTTRAVHNTQQRASTWRALDMGVWQVTVRATLRRLDCRPCGRVIVEAVPFARHRARFTRDFDDLIAWLAARADKTAITQLCRINWRTVGAVIERVVAEQLDDARLDDLYEIGVDEISYRKQHHYLTLVANHRTDRIVWAGEGRSSATLDRFFDELGTDRSHQLTAVSVDMSPAFGKSIRGHTDATVCYDPFHVVMLATKALDIVRRDHWNLLRDTAGPADAKRFKGARWALLKRPEDLTDTQADQLAAFKRSGGAMWRAYQLKEALRAIFAEELRHTDVAELLDRWCAWAQRCRLAPFVKLARTIRGHRDGILAAVRLGITNGRVEGLNNRVRLITRRAFGFHSAAAVAALVMLCCGPIHLDLPHQR